MQLGSLTVAVTDMERAVHFYHHLLQAAPVHQSEQTTVFLLGQLRLVLLHKDGLAFPLNYGNNCVPNFEVEDIESELARIKQLDPPRISDQAISVGPFQLFQFSDPEGNILECFTRS